MPFEDYFKIEPLRKYTNVITMSDFLAYVAPTAWPVGKRTKFCFQSFSREKIICGAEKGSPMNAYWDYLNIEFNNYEFFHPLNFSVSSEEAKNEWKNRYPADKYSVLAFYATTDSAILEENVHLQVYLKWTDKIEAKGNKFLRNSKTLPGKIIGIHLRLAKEFVSYVFLSVFFIEIRNI